MELDAAWLFVSILVSSVGLGILIYGKRQSRGPHLLAGLLLFVAPYFTPGIGWMLGVGAVIVVSLWMAVRLGF
jgi:hypothetical protein